jgi:ABC-type amino acid transport substrate-binding protein
MMDELADKVKMDPVEFRIKNLPPEAPNAMQRSYLREGAEAFGWSTRHPTGDTTPATYPAWNDSSKTITSLKGSTDETLVKTVFPKAKSSPFPDDTAALLQVATGRADAAVIENYLLAAFSKTNPGKLKEAAFKKPLNVQYGSWAVQKGNSAFVKYLNTYLCKIQGNGTMASIYKKTEGAAIPPMPKC